MGDKEKTEATNRRGGTNRREGVNRRAGKKPQKGWLRVRGIIVFGVICLFIAVIWFAFVDMAVKKAIEVVGTEAVGAKVELESADLTLSPLGVTLKGLKVTNPDEPMTNAFEVFVIKASLESGPIFMRKIIVDDLKVEGLRFATARKKSGAIKGVKARIKEKADAMTGIGRFEMPSFEKLDAKAILAGEDLKTRAIIKSLKSDIGKAKGDWKGQIEGLPSKEKIEDYKRRFKALQKKAKSGGFLGMLSGGAEFTSLQKDLKKDLEMIKKANKGLDQTIKSYESRINGISKAVDSDVRRLTDKYLMPSGIIKNITLMIFGERVASMAEKATYWYKRLEPFIERGDGTTDKAETVENLRGSGAWVRFKEKEPLPDFLIRKASVSMIMERGIIEGVITDITPDQKMLGRPTAFNFSSDALRGVKALTLKGTLDHIDETKAHDELTLKVKGFSINEVNIAASALPVTVKSALIDLDLLAGLKAETYGRSLGSKFNMSFGSLKLLKERSTGNKMQNLVVDALTGIDSFRLRGSLTGKVIDGALKDEKLSMSGDLDKIMEKAVASLVTKQALGFKRDLRGNIMKELGGDIDGLGGELGGLQGLSKELTDRLKLGKIDGKDSPLPKIRF